MSAQTDIIRAAANAIDALSPSGIAFPTGVDCLGGTVPTMPTLLDGDHDSLAVVMPYYDRMMAVAPSGTVVFIGHSLIQQMPVHACSPFGQNYGYGGENSRRLCIRLNRLGSASLLKRAGAVVLMTGFCDLFETNIYYPNGHAEAAATVGTIYEIKLAPWITGKWVIIKQPPICETTIGVPGINAAITLMNAAIEAAMVGTSAQVAFVEVPSGLTDTDGNLKAEYHNGDGQHWSKALHDIYSPLIAAQLRALGVQ
jgi:hypothetical protein